MRDIFALKAWYDDMTKHMREAVVDEDVLRILADANDTVPSSAVMAIIAVIAESPDMMHHNADKQQRDILIQSYFQTIQEEMERRYGIQ